jgi:hypothetical protein
MQCWVNFSVVAAAAFLERPELLLHVHPLTALVEC